MTEVAYMVFGMEQTPMLVLPEPLLDSYHPTAEQARGLRLWQPETAWVSWGQQEPENLGWRCRR